MVRIGVLGAGYLGRIHIELLKKISDFQLVGFYDTDKTKVEKTQKEFNIQPFPSIDRLIDSVDAIDIVTPTISHFNCAIDALKKSRHVFIEKPITNTSAEAAKLIELTRDTNVIVQVGHVERFNPAFSAAKPYFQNPLFIESHRLSQFNPRGTDVPVVLDLMIHDIDIVLNIVKSEVNRISASGLAVVSDTPDIANARLEFKNGCVANLTASRISMNNMRRSRFFQKDAYITVDFLNKETEIFRIKESNGENSNNFQLKFDLGKEKGSKVLFFEKPKIRYNNAIEDELRGFYQSIVGETKPLVTIEDGYNALRIAHDILGEMKIPDIK